MALLRSNHDHDRMRGWETAPFLFYILEWEKPKKKTLKKPPF
jgi:hypothetical protein